MSQKLFCILNHKNPGSRWYNNGCFKSSKPIIGEDVSSVILDYFKRGNVLSTWNYTRISLIPRVENLAIATKYKAIVGYHTYPNASPRC